MRLLYIMRHAEAEDGPRDDATRALTDEGKRQAETMGAWLSRQIGRVDVILASPFQRTKQTAIQMGEDLGAEITYLDELEPDVDTDKALKAIRRNWKKETLVVTHHPLVNDLVEELTGAKTDDVHVKHGSILAVAPEKELLVWMVTPDLVERDDDLMDAAAGLAESAAEALTESLKAEKHADTLEPAIVGATKILQRFFRRQARAVIKQLRGHLKTLADGPRIKEAASEDAKNKAAQVIPDGLKLPALLSSAMKADFGGLVSGVMESGYDTLAEELGSDKAISEDAMANWLRDRSLEKIAGNLNDATITRLRNALADAYEAGGDYDALVEAIEDEYSDFSSVRAGMIAQTEMNAAYNQGRKQIGLDLGFNEKSWNPDGTACEEICIPNVAAGWIGIDEEFESGDDAPPGHPNCDCSLDVRFNADL